VARGPIKGRGANVPRRATPKPQPGPPPSGHIAFWAAGDLFDVAAVAELCRKAKVRQPRNDLEAAADLLAVAAGQIMEPGSVPAAPTAVRNWARRVLRSTEKLQDELGRDYAAHRQTHAHLALAATGLVDSRTPAVIAVILAAEEVAPPSNGENVFETVSDALHRLPAALKLLAAAASAAESLAAPNVRRGRRRALWRSFVHDACRAYEAATGRKAGTPSKDSENRPDGPALRFVLAAAEVVRGRRSSLPPLAADFAGDEIAEWVRRGKLRRTGP